MLVTRLRAPPLELNNRAYAVRRQASAERSKTAAATDEDDAPLQKVTIASPPSCPHPKV